MRNHHIDDDDNDNNNNYNLSVVNVNLNDASNFKLPNLNEAHNTQFQGIYQINFTNTGTNEL